MMNYDLQLLNSMQTVPESVFQDGNQRLIYATCDIRETDSDYVVAFKPSRTGVEEKISFDFLGSHLFISGECHPEFSVGVHSISQPIEARYIEGFLEIVLPKSACKRFSATTVS